MTLSSYPGYRLKRRFKSATASATRGTGTITSSICAMVPWGCLANVDRTTAVRTFLQDRSLVRFSTESRPFKQVQTVAHPVRLFVERLKVLGIRHTGTLNKWQMYFPEGFSEMRGNPTHPERFGIALRSINSISVGPVSIRAAEASPAETRSLKNKSPLYINAGIGTVFKTASAIKPSVPSEPISKCARISWDR